jgi:O-antigen/teichoic acid export membrane protein
MLLSSVLQGLGRVGDAFMPQTVGSLLTIPSLLAALALWSAPDALGVSMIVTYGVPFLIMVPLIWRAVSAVEAREDAVPTVREMVRVGGWWQVSSWADFGTFQAPRIAAAFALPAIDTVLIDLALRAGQAAATPIYAFLPLITPRSAQAYESGGREAVTSSVRRWISWGLPAWALWSIVVVPLSPWLIARWGSLDHLTTAQELGTALIVLGVLAHASTGVLTSVLLAISDLQLVARYKAMQLVVVLCCLAVGGAIGPLPLCVGIALALAVPAAWFNARAAREIGVAGRLQWG